MSLLTQRNTGQFRFNSLTELRALSGENLKAGEIVFLSSASPAADGSERMYVWNTSNTDTDDGELTIKLTDTDTGRLKLYGAFLQSGTGATPRTLLDKAREIVSVEDFGTNTTPGTTDMTTVIQKAIDAVRDAGGGTVYFAGETYLVSSPIKLWSKVRLEGERGVTKLVKTSATSYTGTSGVASNAVIYLDDAASSNSDSGVSGIWITGDKTITTGIFLSNAFRFTIDRVRMDAVLIGIKSNIVFQGRISNVRINSDSYAFDFGAAVDKTSIHFDTCYAEAAGGGWRFAQTKYTTLTNCAADWINTGDKPSNPYGSAAGGDYLAQGYVYSLSSSDIVMNGCGCESSTATFMSLESSNVVMNACKVFKCENFHVPSSSITSFIELRGVVRSTLVLNACPFSEISNQSGSTGNLIRGIYVETPGANQTITYTELPVPTGYTTTYAYVGLNGFNRIPSRSFFPDPKFKSNIAATELPFHLWNDGSYTDSTLTYSTSATTKEKSVLIDGNGSTAAGANEIKHHWRGLIDTTGLAGKKVRIRIAGTYSAGGFGNPSASLREAASFSTAGTELLAISLSDGVIDHDAVYTFGSAVAAVVFIDLYQVYAGSSMTISELRIDIIG